MSSGFIDREDAIESKFRHDEEFKFRIRSRRNFLFGCWIAQELGLSPAEIEAYASNIVRFATHEAGDESLVDKAYEDLSAHGVSYTLHQVEKKLEYFHDDAFNELAYGV